MRWRILSIIGLLYTVQYIPATFAIMGLPIILRQEGHSATSIGLMQLVMIPYVIKFLWAPLIDKYKPGRDRYKSWIIVLSAIHLVALGVAAFMDPSGSILPLFIVLLIAVVAVTTQDIAVDALAISLMRPDERTMGASFQNFGIYLGAVVGGFVFLHLYGQIGWTAALLAQAAIFAAPLVMLVFVDEPARPQGAPPVNFSNVLRFFAQPRMGRWLAILSTLRLPLFLILLPIRLMMVDQGMSTEEIALWLGLFAMSAGGVATLLFGYLIRNLPRTTALYMVGLINVAVLIAISLIASGQPDAIRYTIVAAWAFLAMTDIVLFRGAMDKVRAELPGYDFSLQVGILTLLSILANPVAGAVIDGWGYLPVFFAAVLFTLVPLAILRIWIAPFRKPDMGLVGKEAASAETLASK
jgi:predicted MFS family arabinose efflux permease